MNIKASTHTSTHTHTHHPQKCKRLKPTNKKCRQTGNQNGNCTGQLDSLVIGLGCGPEIAGGGVDWMAGWGKQNALGVE